MDIAILDPEQHTPISPWGKCQDILDSVIGLQQRPTWRSVGHSSTAPVRNGWMVWSKCRSSPPDDGFCVMSKNVSPVVCSDAIRAMQAAWSGIGTSESELMISWNGP